MDSLPLADIRIVALEQHAAGPFGSLHLADLGADVIKVEDPNSGGDVGRYIPPFQAEEDSLFFESFNRNKRSVSLDLSTGEGWHAFEDLVRVSDAVYSNLRGDVPARLGLTYDSLGRINPRIVCCSVTGFGQTGPRRAQPGYDPVIQALCGWMSVTGEPDGPPVKSGLSLVDYSAGLVAALCTVAGIHAARRSGRGMDCDLSLFDVATGLLTYLATWCLTAGHSPARNGRSAHPSLVPFQLFSTADGTIMVGAGKEKFWRRLAVALDSSSLLQDERFATVEARYSHRDELVDNLQQAFMRQTTERWIDKLTSAGVPCAPVNEIAEALADEHVSARDLLIEVDHPRFGVVREVATAAKVGAARRAHRRAPIRGEDTKEVLRNVLGYSEDEIEAVTRDGALGQVAVASHD